MGVRLRRALSLAAIGALVITGLAACNVVKAATDWKCGAKGAVTIKIEAQADGSAGGLEHDDQLAPVIFYVGGTHVFPTQNGKQLDKDAVITRTNRTADYIVTIPARGTSSIKVLGPDGDTKQPNKTGKPTNPIVDYPKITNGGHCKVGDSGFYKGQNFD